MGEVGAAHAPNVYDVREEKMKVKIVYEYGNTGYWAKGYAENYVEYATAANFELAKQRLLEKMREKIAQEPVTVPPDEEVEL